MTATVTTTEDFVSGSLREAVESGSGDIEWAVDYAVLKKPLAITRSNFTIDFTTAPSGAASVFGHALSIEAGGDNVTLSGGRLLPGDWNVEADNGKLGFGLHNNVPDESNGLYIIGVTGFVISNMSIFYSMDENLDITNASGVVRNCIIAYPLNDGRHPSGNHGFSCLVSNNSTSNHIVELYNNVFAHGIARNIAYGHSSTGRTAIYLRGNLFYNPGTHCLHNNTPAIADAPLDIVGNTWRFGPRTSLGAFAWLGIASVPAYQSGNVIEEKGQADRDPWTTEAQLSGQQTATELSGGGDAVMSRQDLLDNAGAIGNRWALDQQVIDEIQNYGGEYADTVAGLGPNALFPAELYATAPDIITAIGPRWTFEGSDAATFPGSASYGTGIVGGSVTLAASTSVVSTVSTDGVGGDAFSVAFWFKTDALPAGLTRLASKKASIGTAAGWTVYLHTGGTIRCQLADGTDTAGANGSPNVTATNTWTHIAIVANRDLNRVEVFIDGTLTADGSWGSVDSLATATNFTIGDAATSSSLTFSDVRFFSRAITHADVRAIYEFRVGRMALYPKVA